MEVTAKYHLPTQVESPLKIIKGYNKKTGLQIINTVDKPVHQAETVEILSVC